MDYSKLKKRPSFPFETIAVAVGFSPRLESVLSEAARIKKALGSSLILIHIGAKTKKKEQTLEKAMLKADISESDCQIIFMDGSPLETMLKICKLNIVDLLILGALQRENILNFYLGSFARKISRRAKCSVLLLTNPSVEPDRVKKIIVNGVDNAKTIHTVNTSIYLARHISVKEISVVTELDMPTLSMTMADSSSAPEALKAKKEFKQDEEQKLHSISEKCYSPDVAINEKTVKGKPGYAIAKYAKDKKADLLVINSPDTQLNLLDRIFTHDIEYILADLPCDLLIVHSRV